MLRTESQWFTAGFTRDWWLNLDEADRYAFVTSLTDDELEDWAKDWRVWARDKQLSPEGEWETWILLCGRGFGKTRTAVEIVLDEVDQGRATSIALIGQGADDIRRVMVEGRSGFLKCAKSWNKPRWFPSVGGGGELHWPNGAIGYVYSALDPEALRGPEFDFAWFDEPMAVPAEKRQLTVDNLTFGLRLGDHPRLLYTTTPKPHRWIRERLAEAAAYEHLPIAKRRIVVTRGSTYENKANLAGTFMRRMVDNFEGTSLGRQELHAEILGDEAGAMWTDTMLDKSRIRTWPDVQIENDPDQPMLRRAIAAECQRVVIGVDPNVTASKSSHAAGIVVCGARGVRRYAIDDFTVRGQSPVKWAAAAIRAYEEYGADEIVAEVNQGGDLVKTVIEQVANDMGVDVKVVKVRAKKGKVTRAEPIAAAYERGIICNVGSVGTAEKPGRLYNLESQLCAMHEAYDPTKEDFDRADALVWGMTRLGVKKSNVSSGGSSGGLRTFGDMVGENQGAQQYS